MELVVDDESESTVVGDVGSVSSGSVTKKVSICREFYQKFPLGSKGRCPEELVTFLQNHPSSRIRVDEWLASAASEREKLIGGSGNDGPSEYFSELVPKPPVTSRSPSPNPIDKELVKPWKSKCDDASTRERGLGNAYFKNKNLKQSLHHYNNAIKFACFPQGQEDEETLGACGGAGAIIADNADTCLAIALANRSAVYKELGEPFHDKALQDADLAIRFGYPERLKTKILLRKADIHIRKGDVKKAKECLDEIKAVGMSSGAVETPMAFETNVDTGNTVKKLHELEMQIARNQNQNKDKEGGTIGGMESSQNELEENQDFENASGIIAIRTSEALGRHVVALRDLEEGKLLFKEEPFASVLLPDFYASHCHHCHVQLEDYEGELYFFPCSRCPQVIFCSFDCSEAAEIYHSIECGWLDFLHSVGIAHLALRIILITGVDSVLHCVRNHQLLTDSTNMEIFKPGMNNYYRVYSLLDHICEMFEDDLFQYTLTASLLTTFLINKTKFFTGVGKDERHKIGGAMLRHICQLICNAHAVTDILPDSVSDTTASSCPVIEEYQRRVATAIFPAASIMNHSCDPNISFHFEAGKTLIVKTARPISRDDNVYNCYGPQFSRMSRSDRQEILLEQYFFNCNCDKCDNELDSGVSFADQFNSFKCQKCEGPVNQDSNDPCPLCGAEAHNQQISSRMYSTVSDLLNKGEYLLDKKELDEAIEIFESCYTIAQKILFKYNSQLGQLCDSLARCYVMKGYPEYAQKYLAKSLEYVEARFGKTSAEYLRELKKYEHLGDRKK